MGIALLRQYLIIVTLLGLIASASAQPSPDSPGLVVTQKLPASLSPGQALTIEVIITNTGNGLAENVILNGSWTEGFDLAETSVPNQLVSGRRIWMMGDIAGGKTRTLKLKLTPSAKAVSSEFRSLFDATCQMTSTDITVVKVQQSEPKLPVVVPEKMVVPGRAEVEQAGAQILLPENAGQLNGVKLIPPVAESKPDEGKFQGSVSVPVNTVPERENRVRANETHGLFVAPLFPNLAARPSPPLIPRCPPSPSPCPPLTSNDPHLTPPKLPTQDEIARGVPNQPGAFASQTESGGAASRSFNDNFSGDFGGIAVRVQRQVGGVTVNQSITQNRTQIFGSGSSGPTVTETITVPSVTQPTYQSYYISGGARYSGVLITENDSPRPTTRAYLGGNYYNGINASLNPAASSSNALTSSIVSLPDTTEIVNGQTFSLTNRAATTVTSSQQNTANLANASAVRSTVGFEYAFWNDSASFGMRLPFSQNIAPSDFGGNYLGDLTLLFKYAFVNRPNGDLLSAGLAVSTPLSNSPKIILADGSELPTSVLYQPWVGGIKMFERGYIQGISSLLIPTNSLEPTMINNSIAASYFLYQNSSARFLKMIAPALEVHVRTPLDNRDPNGLIYVQDQVNATASIHFRSDRITVSPAFSVPLLGPKPWNYEAMLWVNMRF